MKKIIVLVFLACASVCAYCAVDLKDIESKASSDPATAIAACEAALTESPDDVNAQKWLAFLYYQAGRYEDTLRISTQGDVQDSSLLNYAGLSLISQGSFQEAIKYFDQAIILDKDWYEPYNNKGIACRGLKNYPAAKNAFLAAYNLQAKETDLSKKSVNVYINYAQSLADLKDYKGALKIFGYAEKLSPDNQAIALNKADVLFRQADYPAATGIYKALYSKDNKSLAACRGLGDCYMMQNNTAEALKYYDLALGLSPDYETAFNAGLVCRKAGQFGNAVKYYQKAVELNPEDYEALNELGWAEFKSGNQEGGLAHIKSALDKKNDYLPAMLNLAALYSGINDYVNAYGAWSLVTLQVPDNAVYRVNLANECHNRGLYQEAIEQYQEAIRLDSKAKGAYYGLGTACIGLAVNNNNEVSTLNRALDAFAKAIEAEPDNSNIYVNQGVAYQYLGKYPEAIAANEKALKLAPQNAVAKKNLDNLKKSQPQ